MARGKEGREEASGGGIERGREGAREQESKGGRETSRDVSMMTALARCIIGNPGEAG